MLLVACGSGSPAGAPTQPSPSLSTQSARIAAITAALNLTNNDADQFVVFLDKTDAQKDGVSRVVQFGQPGPPYHVEVVCSPEKGTCLSFGDRARARGFVVDPYHSNVYAKENVTGMPHDMAVLTDQLFLTVLQAS